MHVRKSYIQIATFYNFENEKKASYILDIIFVFQS